VTFIPVSASKLTYFLSSNLDLHQHLHALLMDNEDTVTLCERCSLKPVRPLPPSEWKSNVARSMYMFSGTSETLYLTEWSSSIKSKWRVDMDGYTEARGLLSDRRLHRQRRRLREAARELERRVSSLWRNHGTAEAVR
jgi:hypothetical protein